MFNFFEKKATEMFKFIIIGFIIGVIYYFALKSSSDMLSAIGIDGNSLFHFIFTIIFTSVFVFISTLLIHYVYQKIKFLNLEQFKSYFKGIHLLYLYTSGLVAVITVFESYFIEAGYINTNFDNILIGFGVMMFFIILTNYTLYNEIVMDNSFNLFAMEQNETVLTLSSLYSISSWLATFIVVVRFLYLGKLDDFFIISLLIINLPKIIKTTLRFKEQ